METSTKTRAQRFAERTSKPAAYVVAFLIVVGLGLTILVNLGDKGLAIATYGMLASLFVILVTANELVAARRNRIPQGWKVADTSHN